jgi:serine/threonine protein kinase
MAPEYSMGKAIDTVKADVYSFGVVLLEIVSGTVSAEYTPNQEEAKFLLDKVSVSDRINPLSFFFFFCSYYQTKHVLPTLDDL